MGKNHNRLEKGKKGTKRSPQWHKMSLRGSLTNGGVPDAVRLARAA